MIVMSNMRIESYHGPWSSADYSNANGVFSGSFNKLEPFVLQVSEPWSRYTIQIGLVWNFLRGAQHHKSRCSLRPVDLLDSSSPCDGRGTNTPVDAPFVAGARLAGFGVQHFHGEETTCVENKVNHCWKNELNLNGWLLCFMPILFVDVTDWWRVVMVKVLGGDSTTTKKIVCMWVYQTSWYLNALSANMNTIDSEWALILCRQIYPAKLSCSPFCLSLKSSRKIRKQKEPQDHLEIGPKWSKWVTRRQPI